VKKKEIKERFYRWRENSANKEGKIKGNKGKKWKIL